MPHPTHAALIAAGQAAAITGEPIYEASIRANLDSASLLVFEQAYFAERFASEQVGGQGVGGMDEGCVVHDAYFFCTPVTTTDKRFYQ